MKVIDGIRVYWPLDKRESINVKLNNMIKEIEKLEEELKNFLFEIIFLLISFYFFNRNIEEEMEKHIQITHKYNEAKDGCQSVLGVLGQY